MHHHRLNGLAEVLERVVEGLLAVDLVEVGATPEEGEEGLGRLMELLYLFGEDGRREIIGVGSA